MSCYAVAIDGKRGRMKRRIVFAASANDAERQVRDEGGTIRDICRVVEEPRTKKAGEDDDADP